MTEPDESGDGKRVHIGWMTLVFVALVVSFLLDLWGAVAPIGKNEPADTHFVQHPSVRDPLLSPTMKRTGFEYNCNSCHRHFTRPEGRTALIAEHDNIKLDHGHNSQCSNCHNKNDFETLKDYQGNVHTFEKSEQLCRSCHGPKYRDWLGGAHGRPNGYWDPTRGESVKTTCVHCHDPHSPAFKPIAPAPAPREARSPGGGEAHHD